MAHFRRICKEKSKKPWDGPEFLAFGATVADGGTAFLPRSIARRKTGVLPDALWTAADAISDRV